MTEYEANVAAASSTTELSRETLHTRVVKMEGFRRSDGLFEIEARLTDTKPFDFRPVSDDRVVQAGDLVHNMCVRIVFDENLLVHDVIAFTDSAPYADCYGAPATLKSLIGLRMVGGWTSEVRKRLPGAASCVHLAGLMVPMAATAYQTLSGWRAREAGGNPPIDKTSMLDSCLAYASHGQIVRRHWPEHYKIKVESGDGGVSASGHRLTDIH